MRYPTSWGLDFFIRKSRIVPPLDIRGCKSLTDMYVIMSRAYVMIPGVCVTEPHGYIT